MDKIKEAQMLVDYLLEECGCDSDQSGKDQNKVAFQKDTLFDDPDRMVKDKEDDKTHLKPVPNTESAKPVTGYDLFKMRRGIGRKEFQKDQKKKKNIKENNIEVKMVESLADWVKKKRNVVQKGDKRSKNPIMARNAALRAALEG